MASKAQAKIKASRSRRCHDRPVWVEEAIPRSVSSSESDSANSRRSSARSGVVAVAWKYRSRSVIFVFTGAGAPGWRAGLRDLGMSPQPLRLSEAQKWHRLPGKTYHNVVLIGCSKGRASKGSLEEVKRTAFKTDCGVSKRKCSLPHM